MALGAPVTRTRRIPLLARRSLPARLQAAVTDYTGYYLSVYRAIADVSGCQTVVDSSKHASLAFCLARREEIGLRVIHLVRDSRAVAYSWTTKVARPDGDTGNYMTTYRPARAAAQWNAQNGALQLLARRGTEVLRLRYEDFVAAPEQAVRQAATFAGLAAGDLSLGFLGSDDESRDALVADGSQPDQLLALANDRSPGLGGARNCGILASRTDLVAFCDDDDRWLPGKLRAQVAALRSSPGAEFSSCGIAVQFEGKTTDRLAGTAEITHQDLIRSRMVMVHSSTYLASRAALLDGIGLVNESIPGGQNEAWDLALRA